MYDINNNDIRSIQVGGIWRLAVNRFELSMRMMHYSRSKTVVFLDSAHALSRFSASVYEYSGAATAVFATSLASSEPGAKMTAPLRRGLLLSGAMLLWRGKKSRSTT